MSLQSVTTVHTVTVLGQTSETGAAMGVRRTYTPERSLSCHVFPQGPEKRDQQGAGGAVTRYNVYFSADPELDERRRLKWGNIIIRLDGPARNAGGFGRLWVVTGEAMSQDNTDLVALS